MSLVKASEADFDLPLIGWFDDGARTFSYDDDLLRCPSSFYEDDDLIGVELVDNSLRRWVIRSVELCSPLPKKRWWHQRWLFIIFFPFSLFIMYAFYNGRIKIDPLLEEIAPLDLDGVKARILQELEPRWASFDPIDSPEYQAELAKIREADTVAGLVVLLEANWPSGFFD